MFIVSEALINSVRGSISTHVFLSPFTIYHLSYTVTHLCAFKIEHYDVCVRLENFLSHIYLTAWQPVVYFKKHVCSCVSTWFRLGDSFVLNYSNLTCCRAGSFLTRKTAEQPNKTQAWHAIMLLSSLARYINTEWPKHPIRVQSLAY